MLQYAVICMNANNLDDALNYAKEAQEINNSEDIKEVISNIEHAKQTKRKPFKSNLLILESNN